MPHAALLQLAEGNFDLLDRQPVSCRAPTACGFARRSARSTARGTLPIIMLVEPGDEARLLRALDMGVNDYLMRPIDRNELLARVRTQIKRKRYSDYLRNRLAESVELAITDPLTGLHNRRYMEGHLRTLVSEAIRTGRSLSVLVADIDHFKSVNDTYGHDVGDAVLQGVRGARFSGTRAASTSRAGSAARSSSSSCRIPTSLARIRSASDCALAWRRTIFRSAQIRACALPRASASGHWSVRTTRRKRYSSAPTMRSIRPSGAGVTASSRMLPEQPHRVGQIGSPLKVCRLTSH